jgi:hypothetical protein
MPVNLQLKMTNLKVMDLMCQAFQATWGEACRSESSVIVVPAYYIFVVGQITFKGPCKSNLTFQVDIYSKTKFNLVLRVTVCRSRTSFDRIFELKIILPAILSPCWWLTFRLMEQLSRPQSSPYGKDSKTRCNGLGFTNRST